MDGTMVDNMMTHHRGWQMVLKNYGLDLTLAEVVASCHGKNLEIIERLFPGRFSEAERERISFEKESWYRSIFLPELKLVAGLAELLDAQRMLELRDYVATELLPLAAALTPLESALSRVTPQFDAPPKTGAAYLTFLRLDPGGPEWVTDFGRLNALFSSVAKLARRQRE